MSVVENSAVTERHVFRWYAAVALLIAGLVVVGGITRLTGSGLSITRWDVVRGTLPPLGAAAWERAFAAYRESPQYLQVNAHFDLAAFQGIYWWEWTHRLLGRLLAVALIGPWVVLSVRRRLPRWVGRRTALVFGMVVFQGMLGWLMVASGLVDRPSVSHFRLAAHLSTALATFSVVVWTALEAGLGRRSPLASTLAPRVFATMLLIQIVWGAFVAGLHAGGIHPTWPKINGQWVPSWAFAQGWGHAVLHHPTAVQFVHRTQAATLLIGSCIVAWRTSRLPQVGRAAFALIAVVVAQFALGVATVLHFAEHPVLLGSLHQCFALVLVSVVIALTYQSAWRPGAAVTPAPSVSEDVDGLVHSSIRV